MKIKNVEGITVGPNWSWGDDENLKEVATLKRYETMKHLESEENCFNKVEAKILQCKLWNKVLDEKFAEDAIWEDGQQRMCLVKPRDNKITDYFIIVFMSYSFALQMHFSLVMPIVIKIWILRESIYSLNCKTNPYISIANTFLSHVI